MKNFSGELFPSKTVNAASGGSRGGGMDSQSNRSIAEVNAKYLTGGEESLVPVGYRQTEVGIIPEEWEIKCLKEIVEHGRLPSGIYKDKNLYGIGTKIIKLGDVFNFDEFKPEMAQRVQLSEEEKRTYCVEFGDIFIALASVKLEGVGKVMLVARLDEPTSYDHNVALIRSTTEVCSNFLAFLLKSQSIRKLIGQNATQVGTTFLKASTILSFPLPIPPKKEQTAIANALSDIDALITELEKLIAKKQAIKTATMQQLLTGRTRLSQFAFKESALREDGMPKGTKPSELGEIPEDWDIIALDDVAKINMGQSPSSSNYNSSGFGLPLVQGNADISGRETIIRNYTSQITKKAEKGDLLLSVRAPVGEVAKATFDCCIGRGVCAIRYSNEYLYHWLVSFETEWEKFSKGSTFDSINSDELKAIEVLLPSEEEQTAIATILSGMDEEIQALEQRLGKTRQIKQGMMQELLTGKTRLI